MKNTVLKILFGLSFQVLLVSAVQAQYATKLTVTDIQNNTVSRNIDAGVSALLTECNKAFFENRTPLLGNIAGLSAESKSAILAMWEIAPFRCIETEIIERGFNIPTGYQVRNIPVALKDLPEEGIKNININIDGAGNLHYVYYAPERHDYKTAIIEATDVTDLRCRLAILNFVENFRTAYNRKDIELLAEVYSDDALIITGKVVKKKEKKRGDMSRSLTNFGFSEDEIEYQVSTKKEYINRLRSIFKDNTRINVVFDSIDVTKHSKYENIYGILLKQGWNTTNYSDVGYLFLMIDFKDGENMEVHVRTWQPEIGPGERPLSKDEIYDLSKFDLYKKR